MRKKELGKAQYKAIRNGKLVKVIATGTVPSTNIKTDLEQLPIEIFPPMYGFFFIMPEILLPSTRDFVYEEEVPYPESATMITILDAEGEHHITIEKLEVAEIKPHKPAPNDSGYCVYAWRDVDLIKIAKCNDNLLSMLSHEFGPETYGECEKYVKKHSG